MDTSFQTKEHGCASYLPAARHSQSGLTRSCKFALLHLHPPPPSIPHNLDTRRLPSVITDTRASRCFVHTPRFPDAIARTVARTGTVPGPNLVRLPGAELFQFVGRYPYSTALVLGIRLGKLLRPPKRQLLTLSRPGTTNEVA